MQALVFGASLAIGLCVPLFVYWAYREGTLSRPQLLLFGIGSGLGAVWEGALVFLVPRLSEEPLYTVYVDLTVPQFVHVVSYSFWDGGLFLVGALLVQRLIAGPHFRTFRWRELGVFVVWGQIQSFAVELTAIGTGMWTYHTTSWNPALLRVGGEPVTAAPQLVWLVAAIAFYRCCLSVYRRELWSAEPS